MVGSNKACNNNTQTLNILFQQHITSVQYDQFASLNPFSHSACKSLLGLRQYRDLAQKCWCPSISDAYVIVIAVMIHSFWLIATRPLPTISLLFVRLDHRTGTLSFASIRKCTLHRYQPSASHIFLATAVSSLPLFHRYRCWRPLQPLSNIPVTLETCLQGHVRFHDTLMTSDAGSDIWR